MSIKMILFDLDGTLLPMDQDIFVKQYFGLLAARLQPFGYDPKALVKSIWGGTAAMVKNDGSCLNEEAFWRFFAAQFGEEARGDEPKFRAFYEEDFDKVQVSCGHTPRAKELIDTLKGKGYRLALATNPIFPAIATQKRIAWAGLSPEDFELITTYENSRYCKPNPSYYRDILDTLGVSPEDCLMIGNDATEDLAATKLGIPVFLLTDCLINKENIDLADIPHGGFDQLFDFIETLD